MDNLTKEQRSYCMSKIRFKNTNPEILLKKELRFHGFKYQPKNIFGNPDFINHKTKTVVFIDGCFWHKCPKCFKEPKSNKQYWLPKLERNTIRREEIKKTYKISGWEVLRIWEHTLK